MPRHGKKYRESAKKVPKRPHAIDEALALLGQITYAKFDQSVDLDVRLNVDPRHADQQVRGTVALPHGTGRTVRVAVFAKGEKIREAEEAGADVVGGEDLVKRVQEGFLDFDAAVATPDMMRDVGKLGRVLGPRGMMPNPKVGTVTFDLAHAVTQLKAGQVEFRVDKSGIVHCSIGRMSFEPAKLRENAQALMTAILRAKPAVAKGQYVRSLHISASQSPSIKLDTAALSE
ncbi:50S ribosomal protein L1 [Candidatus Sumerlaeota bacterium]|nr:50S ribosomal protein L1 [Candidatus Sumerlaeota bacterium]